MSKVKIGDSSDAKGKSVTLPPLPFKDPRLERK
jgi:hypothetical protein